MAAVGPALAFLELPLHQKCRKASWVYALPAGSAPLRSTGLL